MNIRNSNFIELSKGENIDKIKQEGSATFINPRMDEGKAKFPSKEDIVQSNGGMAVQKGNYLYYVNGFVGVEDEENAC